MRRNKYNAKKTVVDNITFASEREAGRYQVLKLLQMAGKIRGLELQPEFKFSIEGKHIFKYRADFAYFDGSRRIIEDSKGFRTREYILKKKIVEAAYHITIQEV